ncbi:MAG: HEAT repeat domain-containing protein [Chitinophagaceae bacterium]
MKKTLFLLSYLLFYHLAFSQTFRVGSIDIYGNRKILADTVLVHLSVKEGDSIDVSKFLSKAEAEKLKRIAGVKHATVNPVCCNTDGNLMLYIGIGENDSVLLKYRDAPAQNVRLSGGMMSAYQNLNKLIQTAVKAGQGTEDDSPGYALSNYLPARKEQLKFITFANQNFSLLATVLRNSKYTEHRAAAAEIIAYSSNRKKVVDHLFSATDDPDEEVRNNATRALGILAGYIRLHPKLNITIPAKPFIRMLNSIVWTDRNKGAGVLMHLTENRNSILLNKLKQKAMPSIIEMAKWKSREHAFFSFIILGRIAGSDEQSLISKNSSKEWRSEIDKMVGKCCR